MKHANLTYSRKNSYAKLRIEANSNETKEAFEFLRKIIDRKADEAGNLADAYEKADVLIDESIVSAGYTINSLKEISLSQVDFERLEQRFRKSPYKNLEISDLLGFFA